MNLAHFVSYRGVVGVCLRFVGGFGEVPERGVSFLVVAGLEASEYLEMVGDSRSLFMECGNGLKLMSPNNATQNRCGGSR